MPLDLANRQTPGIKADDAIIETFEARLPLGDNPRRYVWKAKGEDILRKIDAARQALAALQPASNAISETAH
jgi:hypothetical protein